eukprot:6203750-Pleurochrysis_carterae.AAC.2
MTKNVSLWCISRYTAHVRAATGKADLYQQLVPERQRLSCRLVGTASLGEAHGPGSTGCAHSV